MKGIYRRILAILMAIAICSCMSLTAFAAETEASQNATCYTLEVTSDGVSSCHDGNGEEVLLVSPRSTISGYDSETLYGGNVAAVQVIVQASGWGGMGATVKTSSSWNGYMSLDIFDSDGVVNREQVAVYSNGETYFNDMKHYSPSFVMFSFKGIPSGESVFVEIWVYS